MSSHHSSPILFASEWEVGSAPWRPSPLAEPASSAGTICSGQEIGSCLNDSSYGKTVCLQPGLKPGLDFMAGTAPTRTQQAMEKPLQATRDDNQFCCPRLPFTASPPQFGFCRRAISSVFGQFLSWDNSIWKKVRFWLAWPNVCSQILTPSLLCLVHPKLISFPYTAQLNTLLRPMIP